jgi:hypothetical protein
MADPADLSNLRDLALPPEVSYWPPAPGWWIVVAASLATLAILTAMAVHHHRRNAYRREALRLLDGVQPTELSALLKRAALARWPRAEVASLSGAAWLAFLDRTGRMSAFVAGPGRSIEAMAFGADVPASDVEAARSVARTWLRRHRP